VRTFLCFFTSSFKTSDRTPTPPSHLGVFSVFPDARRRSHIEPIPTYSDEENRDTSNLSLFFFLPSFFPPIDFTGSASFFEAVLVKPCDPLLGLPNIFF